jgi:hypothetical protein
LAKICSLTTALVDEAMDSIEADEERNAAMESEWMKGLKR